MRALVVLTQPPLPEGGAPGKVAIGLLRGLAAHGVDVQAVAAGTAFTGDPPADLPVQVVPVPPLSPWRARLGASRSAMVRRSGRSWCWSGWTRGL